MAGRGSTEWTTEHWTALLRLMSLMVVVDGRVREEELRVFVYRMMGLRRRLAPDMMFSDGMVRDWFAAHRDGMAELSPEARAGVLDEAGDRLGGLGMGREIVEGLDAVSRADGHRHDAERELIADMAARWGVAL